MGTESGTIEGVGWREPPPPRLERKLIREAQGGSREALADLYSAHWRRAHRAAYLVVHDAAAAEDIAQDAFLAAVDALDRFDRRRPFAPWLHRIVVNRAIDWARREALRRQVDGPGEQAAGDPPGGLGDDLMEALAELPPDQRGGGRGLWLVNHLCDLVQVRSSQAGNVIRLHMSIGAAF